LPPDQSFTLVDSSDVKFANATNQAAYVHIPKVSFYLPNNLCILKHLLIVFTWTFLYAYHCSRFCKPGTLDPSKVSGKIVECVGEEILTNNTYVSGHLLGTYSSFNAILFVSYTY